MQQTLIKTNNYIHIPSTYIEKGERYKTSTPNGDSINTTMSFLSAISHTDVLSRIAQSSLRTPHNTGCGCTVIMLFSF